MKKTKVNISNKQTLKQGIILKEILSPCKSKINSVKRYD